MKPTGHYLITGGTGFVGSHLTRALRAGGHLVSVLSRHQSPGTIMWRPGEKLTIPSDLAVDTVVHLAGKNIACLWTPDNRRKILQSRVQTAEKLIEELKQTGSRPKVFISASAAGYYGNRGEALLDEQAGPGDGFLSEVCVKWERAAALAGESLGCRHVALRFGLVLDPSGGLLKSMLPTFRLGLGGKFGNGRQWISWATLADVVRIIRFVAEVDLLGGPVNATSPTPVQNEEFTEKLAAVLGKRKGPSVPAWLLKFAPFGMGSELMLSSARLDSGKLSSAGFVFEDPTIQLALTRLLSSPVAAQAA
jgi:uncharacterized protein